MAPYPSPIADCIERAAAVMTKPRTSHDGPYAAEWAMTLMECAERVRILEMPTAQSPRNLMLRDFVFFFCIPCALTACIVLYFITR